MNRLVLDTDVIIAAMRSPTGASAALLKEAQKGNLALLASVPLFVEYEAKCTAAEHWTAAGITAKQADNFLNVIAALVKPVSTHYLWRPTLHDPNDEMVLEAAVNGQAKAIVTFNLKDYGTVPKQFGIDLINPATAIRRFIT